MSSWCQGYKTYQGGIQQITSSASLVKWIKERDKRGVLKSSVYLTMFLQGIELFKVTVAEVTGQRFVIGMVKIFVNPELICQLECLGT